MRFGKRSPQHYERSPHHYEEMPLRHHELYFDSAETYEFAVPRAQTRHCSSVCAHQLFVRGHISVRIWGSSSTGSMMETLVEDEA